MGQINRATQGKTTTCSYFPPESVPKRSGEPENGQSPACSDVTLFGVSVWGIKLAKGVSWVEGRETQHTVAAPVFSECLAVGSNPVGGSHNLTRRQAWGLQLFNAHQFSTAMGLLVFRALDVPLSALLTGSDRSNHTLVVT